jgi:hypothetical protein
MIYFIYLLLIPISICIEVLAKILNPIFPIFRVNKLWWCDNHSYQAIAPVLPSWLNWFMTPDNSLDGDATFQSINGISYKSKVKWLQRNSAYSFALRYVNAPYNTKVKGDPTIKDNDNAKEGWCFVRSNGLFQLRIVKRWFSSSGCIYVNFGWNIMGLADPNVNPKPDTWQATFVLSPRLSGFRTSQ